jgi:hypothetical protein
VHSWKKIAINPLSVIVYHVFIVFYCSRKINHLVSEPFAFIL